MAVCIAPVLPGDRWGLHSAVEKTRHAMTAQITPNAYFIAAKASTTGRLLTLIMPSPG
jgi:hypothetical protein